MMKKILLALALVSATSLFADMAQWFNATPVQDTEDVLWSLNGEDGSVITNLTDTAYWEIDADVTKAGGEEATVFTPPALVEGLKVNTITRVDISTTFDAMYDMSVGGEDAPLPPPGGSLGALIVGSVTNEDTSVASSNFYAYVESARIPNASPAEYGRWVQLGTGAEVPESLTGEVVHARIELLYLGGVNKIRYSIGTVYGGVTNYVALAASADDPLAGETLFDFTVDEQADDSDKRLHSVEFSGCGKVYQVAAAVRDRENFDDGTGNDDDPYLLASADTFLEYAQKGGSLSLYFKLGGDVTLPTWAGLRNGTGSVLNKGFDGDGHTITIRNLTGSGFFESLDSEGSSDGIVIKDLTIHADNVTVADDAALFAGTCVDGVKFVNCKTTGSLTSTKAANGMLGGFVCFASNVVDRASVTFENCTNAVTLTGTGSTVAAFVAQVSKGNVAAVADTTLATVNGYESYGTIATEEQKDGGEEEEPVEVALGTVPVAFNFCTNGVDDASAYTFYVKPELGGTYFVKKANNDPFYFEEAGTLVFKNPDGQNYPLYTGEIGTEITEADDLATVREDLVATYTYTVGPCVAKFIYENEESATITNKYPSLAMALADAGSSDYINMNNKKVLLTAEATLDDDATVAAGVTLDLCGEGASLTIAQNKTLTVRGSLIIEDETFEFLENGGSVSVMCDESAPSAKVQVESGDDEPLIAAWDGTDDSSVTGTTIADIFAGSLVISYNGAGLDYRVENEADVFFRCDDTDTDLSARDTITLGGAGAVVHFWDGTPEWEGDEGYQETMSYNDVIAHIRTLAIDDENGGILFYGIEHITDPEDLEEGAPQYVYNVDSLAVYCVGTNPESVEVGQPVRCFVEFSDALAAATENDTIYLVGEAAIDSATISKSIALALGDYTIAGEIIVGAGKTLTMAGINPTALPPELTITGADNTAKLNNGTTTYTWNNDAWKADEPEDDNVCQILVEGGDPAKYMTLQAAITAAENGQTIQLINKIDYVQNAGDAEKINVINGEKIINLDLNGKTITAKWASDFVKEGNTFTVFYIEGGSSLTIDDTTDGKAGTIRITECPDLGWSAGVSTVFNHGGTLTINAGTYDNASSTTMAYAFDAFAGQTTINGGTYHAPNYTTFRQSSNGVMVINDGTFTGKRAVYPSGGGDGAKITINGGSFKAWQQVFHLKGSNNDRIDFTININGGTFALDAEDDSIRLPGQSAGDLGGIFNNSSDGTASSGYFTRHFAFNVQDGMFTQRTGSLVVDNEHKQIDLEVYGGTFDAIKDTLKAYVNDKFYDIKENPTMRTVVAKPAENEGVFDVNGSHGEAGPNHGLIKITDEQLKLLPGCSTYTLAGLTADQKDVAIEKLNGPGANGLPRWQSIVLGIPATSDFAAKPTVKATQDTATDSIKFKLGVTPDLNSGAKIRYCLSDGTGGVKVFNNDDTGISIPVSDLFKGGAKAERIKVKIIIDQVNERPVPANN